ncbi:hypothetical protein HA402_009817 [Bradysia odoriphaga]|nr:hypothetical protein HA402_009817 [Bradysia odoriphaga]
MVPPSVPKDSGTGADSLVSNVPTPPSVPDSLSSADERSIDAELGIPNYRQPPHPENAPVAEANVKPEIPGPVAGPSRQFSSVDNVPPEMPGPVAGPSRQFSSVDNVPPEMPGPVAGPSRQAVQFSSVDNVPPEMPGPVVGPSRPLKRSYNFNLTAEEAESVRAFVKRMRKEEEVTHKLYQLSIE